MSSKRTSARGVGARLLLAFFGISAFSALVAGAAIYAFYEVGQSLTLIDRRIDPILASLEVSRSARGRRNYGCLVFVSRRGDRNKQIPAVVRWRRCARSPLDSFVIPSITPGESCALVVLQDWESYVAKLN